MKLELLKGSFSKADALDILTKMVHIKIHYHENKIDANQTEEDVKMRENRIKQLQQEFFEARKQLLSGAEQCSLHADVLIS